uniref:C2H2-type domain-containing protein n=1 Tax=Anopheles christyi TaxID=43041 RepID=A0A182JNR1_9DIPT
MRDTVCRLCLGDTDPDDSGSSVLDVAFQKALEAVFTFKIKFKDDLPEYACKQCSWNVIDFYSYSDIVKSNQEKLQHDPSQTNLSNESFTEDSFGDFEDEESEKNDLETSNSSKIAEENYQLENCSYSPDSKHGPGQNEASNEILVDFERTTSAAGKQNTVLVCEEFIITSASLTSENGSLKGDTREKDSSLIVAGDENKECELYRSRAKRKCIRHPTDDNLDTDVESKLCLSCNRQCTCNDRLTFHRQPLIANNNELYSCEQCDKIFESKWQSEYHQREHTTVKCPCCYKSVPVTDINSHIVTHQRDFRCSTCKKHFLSQTAFKKHKNECKMG